MMPHGPPSRQAIGVRLGNEAGFNAANISQASINNRSYFGISQKSIPGPMNGMNNSKIGYNYNDEADIPLTDRSQLSNIRHTMMNKSYNPNL